MNELEVMERVNANGFPYFADMIHMFVGGSGLHGGRVEGKNDDDYYGIFIEPEEMVIGLREYPHYVWSTAGDTARNQPGDLDVCFYGLRKWCKLAAGGNPTALGFLFAPNILAHPQWKNIQDNSDLFAAREHASAFEGFARQQLERVLGQRGKGKHGQRPELEDKFGYDVKAAMHVIRLLGEGIEYMQTGRITYPRPNKEILIAIRLGKYDASFVAGMAEVLFADLKRAQAESDLPEKADMSKVGDLVIASYLFHWGR